MENLQSSNYKEEFSYNSSKKSLLLKGTIISVISIILFSLFFYFLFLSAPSTFPNQSIFSIKKGDTLKDVSENLKEQHIIRLKVLFETFVVIYGGEKHIGEGDYFFENNLPVFEIARRISKNDRHLAPVKVTIPEGFNMLKIADFYVSKLKNFNKEAFLLKAKNKEGYLFPDTYFFLTTDDEKDVFDYMTLNFDKKIQPIRKSILLSGKTEKDIITMASIVEKEAKGDNDRGIISGILWNRISKKMPLQVDASLETYKTKGLPNSPICNPGIEAIWAAINPVKSNYLYYLHDKTGLIHFASSFTEHRQNILKYLK